MPADLSPPAASPFDQPPPDPSDDEIRARDRIWSTRLRASDMDAFRTIFETYWTGLWHFARRSVPRDVAEDIVQDVMADLWHRRDSIDPNITFAQYLFKAVRNRVSNYWRHERTSQAAEGAYDPDMPIGMGAAPTTPDHLAAANDVETALAFAIRQLPEIQRAVLTLRWVHEMTYEQVAEVLSISPDAARQHGSRAQRTIRPLLAKFRLP